MTTRTLPALALGLSLGVLSLPAQQPVDPDYETDEYLLEQYEQLGGGSDYELDNATFEDARDRTAGDPPDLDPPSADEVREFRGALERESAGAVRLPLPVGPGHPMALT